MERLLVFSDLHGYLSAWLTIKALAGRGDAVAIAGDLFDTRYGNYNDPDFAPDQIRSTIADLDFKLFCIYGNCDVEGFFKGFSHELSFKAFDKTIFMHHGHKDTLMIPQGTDIIIQGHTHLPQLEKTQNYIHLNPGSIAVPRNGMPTFAVIDSNSVSLMTLSGEKLASLNF
ncbi:metallophosphoesterase family protein [Desulfobacter postgatei]|uniref:Phosphoesterase n=1 Tax=Desulfobacter postgatei 2ac9 TaxID=879212 RepID=I5B0I7_9BACT|nr:YfcE family phosphodiesterase [Desulfobacter postgatei]EIM63000.1 phosphoesterase, MJ0936 family [Desulfobacter postgatei 2ac9]